MSTMQSASSSTTRPPEPMIAPTLGQGLVIDRRVGQFGGHAAARGPADLHRLERRLASIHAGARRSATPPPISSTICRRSCPSALRSARRGGPCRPGRRPWCPCSCGVPSAAKASAPWRTIHGTRAKVSTLLTRWACPTAAFGRIGRPQPRHAAPAFDRGQQRRLFAADERPGPFLHRQFEAEIGAHDALAQQAALAGNARAPR